MNEIFAYKVGKYGRPTNAEQFDSAAASSWEGRLPSGLLELWRECGIGMWADGKFQFCRPDRFAGVVAMIFQGDAQFDPAETHLFGFGAFGDLLLWNEKWQNISVSLPYLRGTADAARPNFVRYDPNIAISSTLSRIGEDTSFTLFDDTPTARPLFKACAKRLGRPEPGECYGLFPALALGGSTDIGSVRRARALEHFAILAQLGPVRLIDYSNGRARFVRDLGAQT